jgi:hypothetical protein
MRANVYRVHGVMQSYFTRKMTGYLDYKGIPCVFRRFPGSSPEAMAADPPEREASLTPSARPRRSRTDRAYPGRTTSAVWIDTPDHGATRAGRPSTAPCDPTSATAA